MYSLYVGVIQGFLPPQKLFQFHHPQQIVYAASHSNFFGDDSLSVAQVPNAYPKPKFLF